MLRVVAGVVLALLLPVAGARAQEERREPEPVSLAETARRIAYILAVGSDPEGE